MCFLYKSGADLNTWGNLHAEFEVKIRHNKGYYKKPVKFKKIHTKLKFIASTVLADQSYANVV